MFNKLRKSTFIAALRMGGYIGWYLTVLYICQISLRYYHDDSISTVSSTFLLASGITSAALLVILLLFDFEGLMSDRLMKWLPGLFMAESGVALSLANVGNMVFFSAVAGVAAAFGMMAVMTHLLQVKVGQRLLSIALALALGGGVRLGAAALLDALPRRFVVYVSIAVGILALLTVHSDGFSAEGGPLVSFAEAPPLTILKKIPAAYIMFAVIIGAFFFSERSIEAAALTRLPDGFGAYEYITYAAFACVALLIALLGRMQQMPMIFVIGAGLSTAGGLLASLPYFTDTEARFFALLAFAGLVCARACIYLFIVLFTLDRPHPLFFAVFGSMAAFLAEWGGTALYMRSGAALRSCIILMAVLMPVGGAFLASAMKRHGYSQDKLTHRHNVRALIKKRAAELELFDREQMMVESIVLDGSGVAELSAKMLFSHNTVKVLLRPVFEKVGVSSVEELREHFTNLADDEEKFIARVQEAEEQLREEKRRERSQNKIQSYRNRVDRFDAAKAEKDRLKAERAAQQERELEEKSRAAAAMEMLLTGADAAGEEPAAGEEITETVEAELVETQLEEVLEVEETAETEETAEEPEPAEDTAEPESAEAADDAKEADDTEEASAETTEEASGKDTAEDIPAGDAEEAETEPETEPEAEAETPEDGETDSGDMTGYAEEAAEDADEEPAEEPSDEPAEEYTDEPADAAETEEDSAEVAGSDPENGETDADGE